MLIVAAQFGFKEFDVAVFEDLCSRFLVGQHLCGEYRVVYPISSIVLVWAGAFV